jgi:hypothetical protein
LEKRAEHVWPGIERGGEERGEHRGGGGQGGEMAQKMYVHMNTFFKNMLIETNKEEKR